MIFRLYSIIGYCKILNIFPCAMQKILFLIYFTYSSLYLLVPYPKRFPGGASDREPACQCRRHKRHGFDPWVEEIPWKRTWQLTSVFLPGESHGQRSQAGYSPQSHKELDTSEVTQHARMVLRQTLLQICSRVDGIFRQIRIDEYVSVYRTHKPSYIYVLCVHL